MLYIPSMKKNAYFIYPLIFFLFFLILNKISKNFLENTKWEKNKKREYVEKVYGKENIDDYLLVLEEQTVSFIYEPFVEIVESQRKGKFISVSAKGNRCNKNNIAKCEEPLGGKNEIWLFGGSTTFGYGVKNNETISAYLENLYGEEKKVINFGSGFYFSTQEKIRFQNLLTDLNPPYAAIFLDGVNELGSFWPINESAYSSSIRNSLNPKAKEKFHFSKWLKKKFINLYIYQLVDEKIFDKDERKPDLSSKKLASNEQIKKSIKILKENHKQNRAIGNYYNINIVNVLQPAPIYNFSYNKTKVPKELLPNINNANSINLKKAYKYINNKNSLINDPLLLNISMLKIDKAMYVDGYHYTPLFNKKIAEEIYTYLINNF